MLTGTQQQLASQTLQIQRVSEHRGRVAVAVAGTQLAAMTMQTERASSPAQHNLTGRCYAIDHHMQKKHSGAVALHQRQGLLTKSMPYFRNKTYPYLGDTVCYAKQQLGHVLQAEAATMTVSYIILLVDVCPLG